METLVNSIAALSATAEGLGQLATYLKSQVAESVLDNPANNCLTAAQHLDAAQHSVGIVFLLNAHARRANPNADGAFAEYTAQFLRSCSAAQVQHVPDAFCELCRKYKEQLLGDPRAARSGVAPLLAALQRLAPSAEHLTPIHADVLQLCLLAKTYGAAAALLGGELTEVDPTRTAVGPTDLQLYCYYGGMVAAGRKQLARALELFLQGLTAPTYVCSAITAATYRKYVLVSLIHSGAVPALPKFTSQKVRQLTDAPDAKPYADLASAYAAKSHDRLARVAEQHSAVFAADRNVGLVRQVLASLPARTIQRLTQTYVTLSLADIAKAAGLSGPAEAEAVILRMVSCRQVFARINDRDGMVTFMQDPEQYNSADMARRIDGTIRSVMGLAGQVQSVQDGLLLDRSYLGKLVMRERGGGGLGGLGGGLDADLMYA
ncbi:CSN3 [Scenedesmus sp. PABB004]|nr:CSN3 [Scenedesmus sp. PABB004]